MILVSWWELTENMAECTVIVDRGYDSDEFRRELERNNENMINNKTKILHIANMQKGSGVASFLMNYFRYVDRSRFKFYFLSTSNVTSSYNDEITRLGGTMFMAPYYKSHLFKYLFYLNKVIREEYFDIIHCHEFVLSVFALVIARKKRIRVRIIHSHNNSINSTIKRCIVFFSHFLFKLFATDFFSCSNEAGKFLFGNNCKITTINNAVDIDNFTFKNFNREDIRSELKIPEYFHVIGHVGRFSEQKNHLFILKVFTDILLREKHCILLLVGLGEKYQEIKNLAVTLNISDKVIFYGLTGNTAELYSAMDIFIFPSLFEGLPIVGIEAQCAGLPVVASTNIPRQMQVTDLVTWLDLSDGSDKWADEVIRILSQENGRKDMSNIITDAGYNILVESKKLEQKYIELVRKSSPQNNLY
jgi:glycosyltransferase involved in cell wall biosynthesis